MSGAQLLPILIAFGALISEIKDGLAHCFVVHFLALVITYHILLTRFKFENTHL